MRISMDSANNVSEPKRNGYLKLIPEKNLYELREMNNSMQDILMWEKRNVRRAVLFILVFGIFGVLIDFRFAFLGIVFAILDGRNQFKKVSLVYQQFRFERQLQFFKFARLLIPLLKQTGDGVNLNAIFIRLVNRMPHDIDKNLLQKLITDMSYYSGNFYPFEVFANQMSGSENSVLFMQTLFDLDQGALDLTVIERLGQIASKEMMSGIDQIIAFKERKFSLLYTKILMSVVVLMFGFGISIVVYQIGEMGIFF
ncbi:hypothetical protein [Enterococcus casseliflavus]|uniref:hypothetical protein n=1 Tax=Enterococcus casseliflavus TaxID=37734 RepID=UPI0018AC3031|nr:hypothetical protein [Enterococcus casseliflavus]